MDIVMCVGMYAPKGHIFILLNKDIIPNSVMKYRTPNSIFKCLSQNYKQPHLASRNIAANKTIKLIFGKHTRINKFFTLFTNDLQQLYHHSTPDWTLVFIKGSVILETDYCYINNRL